MLQWDNGFILILQCICQHVTVYLQGIIKSISFAFIANKENKTIAKKENTEISYNIYFYS